MSIVYHLFRLEIHLAPKPAYQCLVTSFLPLCPLVNDQPSIYPHPVLRLRTINYTSKIYNELLHSRAQLERGEQDVKMLEATGSKIFNFNVR